MPRNSDFEQIVGAYQASLIVQASGSLQNQPSKEEIFMLGSNAQRNVKLRAMTGVTIAIIISCFFAGTSGALAQVDGFKIIVPNKTAIGQVQIKKLKITVTVADETPVTFKVSDPRTPPIVRPSSAVAFMPDGPGFFQAFVPIPPGAANSDSLSITTPTTAGVSL